MLSMVLHTSDDAPDLARRCAGPIQSAARPRTAPLCDLLALPHAYLGRLQLLTAATSQPVHATAPCADGATWHVLLDGYLIAPDPPATLDRPAQAAWIAGQLALPAPDRMAAPDLPHDLDGSFILCAVRTGPEGTLQRGLVLTDPAASRPVFVHASPSALLAQPQLKCFDPLPESLRGQLDRVGLLSLALNSFCFGEHTWWTAVQLLGPAQRVDWQPGQAPRTTRWWAPRFDAHAAPPSVDEAGQAVVHALTAHTRVFGRPVVALSGGVDSRLILAALLASGREAPDLFTWTYPATDRPGADFDTARAVANALPVGRHTCVQLDHSQLAADLPRIVELSDGLIGHLGAFADRERLAQAMAEAGDAILFGDQCYRGEALVSSRSQAIAGLGIVPAAPRLQRALVGQLLADTALLAEYRHAVDRLVDSAQPEQHADPQDLHDRLYWQTRVPRLLTAPKALYRMYVDPLSPLLARPAIELATRLSKSQRENKHLLRELTVRLCPGLGNVAHARTHSRIRFRDLFAEDSPLTRTLIDTILDAPPTFWRIFHQPMVECVLFASLPAAARHRRPASSRGWSRVLLRLAAKRIKPGFVLNLATIALRLRHLQAAGSVA